AWKPNHTWRRRQVSQPFPVPMMIGLLPVGRYVVLYHHLPACSVVVTTAVLPSDRVCSNVQPSSVSRTGLYRCRYRPVPITCPSRLYSTAPVSQLSVPVRRGSSSSK
ncbi:unnamed protein product, partial [Ectocarpus fasciculatus]